MQELCLKDTRFVQCRASIVLDKQTSLQSSASQELQLMDAQFVPNVSQEAPVLVASARSLTIANNVICNESPLQDFLSRV